MKKEKKEKHFIAKPYYEGGLPAMRQYLHENLKYPKEALANRIEGTIRVKYTINYLGKVIDAKVVGRLGYGCDEEAIRLVKGLIFVAPKLRKHIKVKFHKSINIAFALPLKQARKVNYQYTQQQKIKPKAKKSYQYTVVIGKQD